MLVFDILFGPPSTNAVAVTSVITGPGGRGTTTLLLLVVVLVVVTNAAAVWSVVADETVLLLLLTVAVVLDSVVLIAVVVVRDVVAMVVTEWLTRSLRSDERTCTEEACQQVCCKPGWSKYRDDVPVCI